MIKKLHIFITLFASIVYLVMAIFFRVKPSIIVTRLIFVICTFYIIGLIMRLYVVKKIFSDTSKNDDKEEVYKDDKSLTKEVNEEGDITVSETNEKADNDEQ